jgi:TetR/AcrR family transcriptional regulator, repressor of fatR-cypB operon
MCPRPRSPEAEERILEAATALFAEKGFSAVTVPAIAARARVGLGTLYARFSSKSDLGNAVFRRAKRAWAHATLDALCPDDPPQAQFHAYWARLREFTATQRHAAIYLEREPLGHALDEESQALRDEMHVRSAKVLLSWMGPSGIRRLPVEVAGALIHGTFWGVADLPVAPRRSASLLRHARDAVWRALAGSDPPS